ncbi:hypothetical protein [Verrucosispora sioxanthis]|uniref:hypothetical protein n=1 Tax=Verrucosispora sioxanthis TaxID=2499994 RepID=UPI00209FD317|nr:hypothetical protein [Verrucosispora sioxanthis]
MPTNAEAQSTTVVPAAATIGQDRGRSSGQVYAGTARIGAAGSVIDGLLMG